MADPFSALAGASAAIQFLDFSARFLEKTYNVYKAGDGAARNVMELEVAADRLKAAAKANDSQELHSANATAAEKGMATLCDECKVFADQLVTDLASFKENSKPGLWSSAKMVFRADRRREELRAHEKRIEALKAEMSAQLLRVLCDRQSTSTAALEALRCRDVALQASISAGMTQLRDDLVSRLDQQKTPKALGDIQVLIERLIDDAKNTRIKQSMIGSLCYEGMDTRREIISETHADTYRWIFSPDEDRGRTAHLREWLRNGDGIFWVSGKPGSGKSTLMKFIHRHPQTTKLLEDWAGKGKRLVTASHFFWINGSDIQKSQTGLLREMCAAVARQCPVVLLDRWKQLGMSPEDWSESLPRIQWSNSTLRQMLSCVRHVLLDDEGRGIRFVFFIDGLDEYSGDHEDLTGFFRQLTLSGNIKMCVAGRPWNVFERALGNDENLKLYMQRLTHEDISTFVQDKIGTDEHFKDLLREDSTTLDIIETIVSRADGVFLWVHLVERQVHRSLVNRDGLETLRRRILQMPADLNEYFQYMFDSLDPFYRRDTARTFRMCLESSNALPLFGFVVLDSENDLTTRADSKQAIERSDIISVEQKLHSQLRARCEDLIDIHGAAYQCVVFMHRTVKDFLELQPTDMLVRQWHGDDFDHDQYICEAYVACAISVEHLATEDCQANSYNVFTNCAVFRASEIEYYQQRTPTRELDRLWRHAQVVPETISAELRSHWESTKLEP